MKSSRSEFLEIRGLRYHVRRWGRPGAPQVVLLHGWMDVAASFQFVVDALKGDWDVIAPDWRGFGLSEWRGDAYWFPDYLGDLDTILGHYSPGRPAHIVGHSMGGNVAGLYGGVRPERVSSLVSLEGFGLRPTRPEQAPERYRAWLEQLHGEAAFRAYATRTELGARLMRENPRLSEERAAFLASHLGVEGADGRIQMAGDPWHKLVYPVLFRLEEAMACWRRIEAPVLWVCATDSPLFHQLTAHPEEYRARLACFRDIRELAIQDAGHNMHHDQPEQVAKAIESFLLE